MNGITSLSGAPLSGDNDVEIRALVGDANQNRTVDKSDLLAIKSHFREPLDQMSGNYLFDLDLNGRIGEGDGPVVRRNKSHMVP